MKKPTDYRSDEYPGKARLSDDSEGLGFWGDKKFVVGHVPEVNGSEACEVPEFVPTKHELMQIAKYWSHRLLDNQFFFFSYAQTGSSEIRVNPYAHRRINRIARILPKQELRQAIEEVEHDFKQSYKISDAVWDIFKNGTPEERQLHQDKVLQECESNHGDPSPVGSKE